MRKYVYPACFYPCEEMEGYTVVFPDLPGCVTQGKSLADAIEMAEDAAAGWIVDCIESGEFIPSATVNANDIELEYPNGFINWIVLDLDAFSEKYGENAVRKNLTIPSWLNTAAEKHNINFSNVLQNALMEQLEIRK